MAYDWTEQRIATLTRMIEDGSTHKAVADEIGTSPYVVSKKSVALGLAKTTPRWTDEEKAEVLALRKARKEPEEIASILGNGRTADAVMRMAARLSTGTKDWTPAEMAKLRSLLDRAEPHDAMVRAFLPDRSRASVAAKLRQIAPGTAPRSRVKAIKRTSGETAAPDDGAPDPVAAVRRAFVALMGRDPDRRIPSDREALVLFAAVAAARDPQDAARYARVDRHESDLILAAMDSSGTWPAGSPAPAAWNADDPFEPIVDALRRISLHRAKDGRRLPLPALVSTLERGLSSRTERRQA